MASGISFILLSGCLLPGNYGEACEAGLDPETTADGLQMVGEALRLEYWCGPEFHDLSHYEFTVSTPDGYVYQLPAMGEVSESTFVGWIRDTIRPGEVEWALPPPEGVAAWTFELRGWADGPNHPRHEGVPFDDRPSPPSVLVSYDDPEDDNDLDPLPSGVYTFTIFAVKRGGLATQSGVFVEDGTGAFLWGLAPQAMFVH